MTSPQAIWSNVIVSYSSCQQVRLICIPSRAEAVSLMTSATVNVKFFWFFCLFVFMCTPLTLWNAALTVPINPGSFKTWKHLHYCMEVTYRHVNGISIEEFNLDVTVL